MTAADYARIAAAHEQEARHTAGATNDSVIALVHGLSALTFAVLSVSEAVQASKPVEEPFEPCVIHPDATYPHRVGSPACTSIMAHEGRARTRERLGLAPEPLDEKAREAVQPPPDHDR